MRYTKTSSFLDAGPVSSSRVCSSPSPQSLRDSSPRAVAQLLNERLNVLPPLSHCVTAPLQGSGAVLMLCVALPPLSHCVTAPLQGSGAVFK